MNNEDFLRALRAKGIEGDNGSVGLDRAYALLDEIDVLRAQLAEAHGALGALVGSLPMCDVCKNSPATRSPGRGRERRCDTHAMIERSSCSSFVAPNYPRAAPLRRAMAILKEATALSKK